MAEVWVRLPLGALETVPNGMSLQTRSMVEHQIHALELYGFESRPIHLRANIRVGSSIRFCDLHGLHIRVWESLAFRVRREHETAGSNPAILTIAVGPVLVREGGC